MKHKLEKGKPLVLRFRLYINSKTTPDEKLSALWDDFNRESEK